MKTRRGEASMLFTVNRNPSETELRKFGRAMLLGFGALGLVLWILAARRSGGAMWSWVGSGTQVAALVLVALGATLFVLSWISTAATKAVYIAWMTVTVPIGIVMSTVLLTLLYVFVLPVFSVIVRFSDPLRKKLGGSSYWEEYRSHEPTLERMRRPF